VPRYESGDGTGTGIVVVGAIVAFLLISDGDAPRVCGDRIAVVDGAQVGSEAHQVVIARPLIRYSGNTALRAVYDDQHNLTFETTGTYQDAQFYDLNGNPVDGRGGCSEISGGYDDIREGTSVNIKFPLNDPAQVSQAVQGALDRLNAPVS
jgi:hypothetical protein